MFFYYYRSLMTKYTPWRPATTITGPNDASGVVWAISKLFFFFFHVVSILTTTFRYYMWFKEKEWPREGIDDRKRAISIFVFFCVLSILTIIFKLPPRPPPTRSQTRRWCFLFFFWVARPSTHPHKGPNDISFGPWVSFDLYFDLYMHIITIFYKYLNTFINHTDD